MEAISKHISYREATRSTTALRRGIKNTPSSDSLAKMKTLALKVFEPIRTHFNVPIRINSFYRSAALNTAIGGSKTSQHTKGEAIDIDDTLGGVKNIDIVNWVSLNLDFDQMIIEFPVNGQPSWVHISIKVRRRTETGYWLLKKCIGKQRIWFGTGRTIFFKIKFVHCSK